MANIYRKSPYKTNASYNMIVVEIGGINYSLNEADTKTYLKQKGMTIDQLQPNPSNVSSRGTTLSELSGFETDNQKNIAAKEASAAAIKANEAKNSALEAKKAGQPAPFRGRNPGESMTNYLKAKNSATPGSVDFGSTTQLPSGVLVRDKSNGKVYFIDGEKKLRYITDPALIQGKDVVDVDSSHLDLNKGADISTKPEGWDFPSGGTGTDKMNAIGINWQEPRGYDPSKDYKEGDIVNINGEDMVIGVDGNPRNPYDGEIENGSGDAGDGGSGDTGDTGGEGGDTEEETPQMPQAVIDKFYQAYGKFPSASDIKDWASNKVAYENILDQEITKKADETQAEDDKINTADENERIANATKIIDDAVAAGTLPLDIAELWKTVVKNYPPGVEYNAQEILDTFEKIKTDTIDPYFKELTDLAINDVKEAYGMLEGSRNRETEIEKLNKASELKSTQAELEARGMTFSGEAVKELGEEAAVPFGGAVGEGELAERQRLLSSSSAARYQEAAQSLGRSAEGYLGTEKAGLLGIPYSTTPDGVKLTGSLATEKSGKEASTLQGLINQYKTKQELLTNT